MRTNDSSAVPAGVDRLLVVENVSAAYGPVKVLHGISLEVGQGEVVVVLGANRDIVGKKSADVARLGVAHVPQGRGTFADLTVEDNLRLGAFARKDKDIQLDRDRWYDVFPVLGSRRAQMAGTLSGGEQQMLAVARALMGRPRLLLLDEPSLGLAPMIVQDLFRQLETIKAELGTTMLVVEQNASVALAIADRGYVIEAGQIVVSGTAAQLQEDDAVRAAYLGY
jgi:branched-chain amino acid transport system ATP-binding protein